MLSLRLSFIHSYLNDLDATTPNLLGLNDFVVLFMFFKKQTVGKAYVKGTANK
jgi:hypothetical protein